MRLLGLICVLGCFFCASHFVHAGGTEVATRTVLRVCSDPSNLPYSNRKQEGFENKISDLLASDLGIGIAYTWYPQSMGFVRSTLHARNCDIIMGISSAHGLVLNTNPYYFSIFTMLVRKGDFPGLESIADDRLTGKRIGVIAGTPPVGLVLVRDVEMVPYHLFVDTRVESPSGQMVADLLASEVDVAVLWGTYAGYLAGQHPDEITTIPMVKDETQSLRLSYPITLGVRHGEILWKRRINTFIRKKREEIDIILKDYNIITVSG